MTAVNSGETISSSGYYELNLGDGNIQIGVATAAAPNPPFTVTIDKIAATGPNATITVGNDDVIFFHLAPTAITIDAGSAETTGNGHALGGGGKVELGPNATVVAGDVVNLYASTLQVDGFAAGQLDNLVVGGLTDSRSRMVLENTHGATVKSDGNVGGGTKFEIDNAAGGSLGTFVVGGTNLAASSFKLTYNAATNTTVVSGNLCVMRGTRIATPDGEVAVETLAVGDRVRTVSGTRPIVWIGSRTHRAAELTRADMLLPIRIRAGAIAANTPMRDLRVSPDHAILLDGKLVPARLLINGGSVVQERLSSFEYFHVELDAHDALIADGLAVESFLNVGSARDIFADPKVAVMRFETTTASVRDTYARAAFAPLVTDAAAVEPIWRAVAARCGVVPADTEAPRRGLPAIMVEGRRLSPISVDGDRLVFALPAGVSKLGIHSAAAIPAQARPWLDDRRMLGVAVSRLRIREAAGATALSLDDVALGRGWWAIEGEGDAAFRWTDGAAAITLKSATGQGATLELTIHAFAPVAMRHYADAAASAVAN